MSKLIHCLGLSSLMVFFEGGFSGFLPVPTDRCSRLAEDRFTQEPRPCLSLLASFPRVKHVYVCCEVSLFSLKEHKGVLWGWGVRRSPDVCFFSSRLNVGNSVEDLYSLHTNPRVCQWGSHYSLGHRGLLSNICSLQ